MLELAKKTLRITTDQYDDEIRLLIDAALLDLGIAGITQNTVDEADDVVRMAVLTYCRLHHGSPDDRDFLQASYNEQKAQLQTATGYTNWGGADAAL